MTGATLRAELDALRAGGVDEPESLGKFTRPMPLSEPVKPLSFLGAPVPIAVVPLTYWILTPGAHSLPWGWKIQFLVEQDAANAPEEPSWYRCSLIDPTGQVIGNECGTTTAGAFHQLAAALAETLDLEIPPPVGQALISVGLTALFCLFHDGGVRNG